MSRHLGMVAFQVRHRAKVLGLYGKIKRKVREDVTIGPRKSVIARGNRLWTEDEDKFILENWCKMSVADVGKALGRTNRISLITRAKKLGIKRTDEQLKAIREKGGFMADNQLAELIAKRDQGLARELLNYPELINAKRLHIILKRKIKQS